MLVGKKDEFSRCETRGLFKDLGINKKNILSEIFNFPQCLGLSSNVEEYKPLIFILHF